MKYKENEVKDSRKKLLLWLKPEDIVYTILRHVSQSGMMRHISIIAIKENEPITLDYHVARLLGEPMAKGNSGIKRSGCGMDIGFDIVYSLSTILFGDGYKLKHRWL